MRSQSKVYMQEMAKCARMCAARRPLRQTGGQIGAQILPDYTPTSLDRNQTLQLDDVKHDVWRVKPRV